MNNQQGDFQTAQTLETFGFLPKLTQDEVYDQITYLVSQGLTLAIAAATFDGFIPPASTTG